MMAAAARRAAEDAGAGDRLLQAADRVAVLNLFSCSYGNAPRLLAKRGWTIDEHRRRLGALCARFAAVAADNPYAWFRERRSADEIATVTPENRLIGFPYPKLMNAIIDVDQAAAVILTSAGRARAL